MRSFYHSFFYVFVLLWTTLQMLWLQFDHVLRDGDEEGHIGAAELFRDVIENDGWLSWIQHIWLSNFGDYPSVFAGLLGAWWAILEFPPSHWLFRSFNSGMMLIMVLSCARIIWRLQGNWQLGAVFCLTLPLTTGISRHYMPEMMMMALSCLSIVLALEYKEKMSLRLLFLFAVTVGLGALTKQTFIIVAPFVLLVLLWDTEKRWQHLFLFLLLTGIIAVPWYVIQFLQQTNYIEQSITSTSSFSLMEQLLFYPSTILSIGWGIVHSLIFCWLGLKAQNKTFPKWLWVWLATLLIFVLLPKKYPRLLLAWLPIGGILLGLWSRNLRLSTQWLLASLFFIELLFLSFLPALSIPFQAQIDNTCPQQWLRNPIGHNFQLDRIVEHISSNNQTIAVLGDPLIPCEIQTTHNWKEHLDPYLRRRGFHPNIELVMEKNSLWKSADIQIEWKTEIATNDTADLLIMIKNPQEP